MGVVTFFLSLFGGWRVFFGGLLMTILSVVLYNLVVEVLGEVLEFVIDQLQGVSGPSGSSGVMSFTGFGAWWVTHLRLPECLSFILSCVVIKWTVRKIPFLKW